METVTRNVRDLGENERSAAERLVGHGLRENQQLIIQVVSVDLGAQAPAGDDTGDELPSWCNVYEGLSDEQIADLEAWVKMGAPDPRVATAVEKTWVDPNKKHWAW